MHEGDLEAEHARARLDVDQLGARLGESGESGVHVVDLVGDVMHPGPALREELADRRIVAKRREQLDAAVADADGRRLDALGIDAGPMLEPAAEETLVGAHRLVEVHDGQADVVDPSCFHPGDAIRSR